jgi:hypothetical protein
MASDKGLFVVLCLAIWFINAVVSRPLPLATTSIVWNALVVSVVTVPLWALVGSGFSALGVFVFRLLRIDVTKKLTLWQKADIGLALAIVLKPALGIPI